ncbi:DUF4064 domain-containing protein [Jeotgalibacillus campisalis]|uniref:DUF4064 domain-containing protein n=1 Tax=Jeotgalibacillus campisalis TaxID=220754 RepID=A0A0C2REL8_9BACL|nr:DUF4064 domain-containing protein [Jeotgalibacillus campisalis]KIL48685.1 hypothetical protein KR50_12700 [Jeotgalibacillus campisalis]
MKRTAEIVLSVIGVILNILLILGVFVFNTFLSDEQLRSELEAEMANDPDLAANGADITGIFDFLNGLGVFFNIVIIISTILSIVAIVVVRGNRKPKLAGGLLIGSAVLVFLGTFLIGWLPALLFLIAGIMCFARKPKVQDQHMHDQRDDELRPL